MEKTKKEYWWTSCFRTGQVLPLGVRILVSPVYALYVIYLCIKGLPIEIEIKKKKGEA